MSGELPDFERAREFENGFYLTTHIIRIGKILAHWELFNMVSDIPGAIVECGVFKGASLARSATFHKLVGNPLSKKIVGFDTFGKYPETGVAADKPFTERFIIEAGEQSVSRENLMMALEHKECEQNVELVEGDICKTVPVIGTES